MKKKLGRPRKKPGVISFRTFERAAIVMSLYDEARKNGQKHSAAVAQAVELIKRRSYLGMRISETEVKRILAAWRPRGSHIILRFECSVLSEGEPAKRSRIEPQMAAMSHKKDLNLPAPSDVIPPQLLMAYKMLIGEKPNYPRHNQKPAKD